MQQRLLTRWLPLSLLLVGAAAILIACGGGGNDDTSDPVAETERSQALGLFDKLPVSWTPTKVVTEVGLGASLRVPVTLTTTKALTNARVVFVPDFRNAVTVSPSTIPSLAAGQSATVTLTFATRANDTRKVIAGVVLLYDKNATVSRPLPVKVTPIESSVWPTVAATDTVGVTVKSPPGWFVDRSSGPTRLSLQNVLQMSPPSAEAFSSEAIIRVARRVNQNPSLLPMADWVTERLLPALPTPATGRSPIVVSGKQGVRVVFAEIGGDRAHIYLPSGPDVIEISYGLYAAHFVSEYETILSTMVLSAAK
jgi:hypothetical protein